MIELPPGEAANSRLEITALAGIPAVRAGQDLVPLVIAALGRESYAPRNCDVLVFAQKVVSKSENRFVDLRKVVPSARALEIAATVEKDPRLVEVILGEATSVIRTAPGVLIVKHRCGYVVANAAVDQSNTGENGGDDIALMLPENPDRSAALLSDSLTTHYGLPIAVIVSDSFGRPWRLGTMGIALGAAGLPSLLDLRGTADLFGRTLRSTEIGFADEVAACASLVMGQAAEGRPVVLVRGLSWSAPAVPACALIRPLHEDLFK